MNYSNTTYYNGILQNIERYTDLGSTSITGDTNKLRDITAYANEINKEIWFDIFKSNGLWQYDDGGNSDLPIATTSLVSGTGSYSLPVDVYTNGTITTNGALTVLRIEIKDSAGEWDLLEPISLDQIPEALDEFLDTNDVPRFYKLLDNTVQLYPAPNYNSTNGMKIYFDRSCVEFLTSDTTKTPGFASPFHDAVALGTAIKWLKIKQPNSPTLPNLIQDYMAMRQNIVKFYNTRFKNITPKIGREIISYK